MVLRLYVVDMQFDFNYTGCPIKKLLKLLARVQERACQSYSNLPWT